MRRSSRSNTKPLFAFLALGNLCITFFVWNLYMASMADVETLRDVQRKLEDDLRARAEVKCPQQPKESSHSQTNTADLEKDLISLQGNFESLREAKEREVEELQSKVDAILRDKQVVEDEHNEARRGSEVEAAAYQEQIRVLKTNVEALKGVQEARKEKEPRRWLTVILPTIPRIDSSGREADYLTPTLDSFLDPLPTEAHDPLFDQVWVVVFNNRPGRKQNGEPRHPAFERARQRYQTHVKSRYVQFVENNGDVPNPNPGRTDKGTTNIPGARVRQQTLDVVAAMNASYSLSHYFLLTEDDFVLCPRGYHVLEYILSKATRYNSDWIAIRVSFGLSGVLLHSKDVPELARYLRKNHERRPPDHLTVEWFARETEPSRAYIGQRPNMAFKFNILHHIGTQSTLRPTISPTYPRCYELLGEPVLFSVRQAEAWNEKDCPHDDIWPCTSEHAERSRLDEKELLVGSLRIILTPTALARPLP